MTRWMVPALLVFSACGSSPAELCQQQVDVECRRIHECGPDETKQSAVFKDTFGTDVADCRFRREQAAGCAAMTKVDHLCAKSFEGPIADPGALVECLEALEEQVCLDYLDDAKKPASCARVCRM